MVLKLRVSVGCKGLLRQRIASPCLNFGSVGECCLHGSRQLGSGLREVWCEMGERMPSGRTLLSFHVFWTCELIETCQELELLSFSLRGTKRTKRVLTRSTRPKTRPDSRLPPAASLTL